MARSRNTLWGIVKWASIGLGTIVLLLLSLILFISTPYGQRVIKNQGEKYLRNKLHTNLAIGSFRFELKKGVKLTDIYLEDQQKRKLLSVHQLDLNYNFNALLNKNIQLSEIRLRGVQVNLYRDSTSEKFNFDFISEAFTLNEPKTVDDTTSAFTINLGKLNLDSISFLMDDQYGRQKYAANINMLKTDLRKTDLDKLIFHADYIFTDGVNVKAYLAPTKKTANPTAPDIASTNFQFVSDTLGLTRTSIRFESISETPITVITDLGSLQAKGVDYRSEQQSLVIGFINLQDHSSNVETRTVKTTKPDTLTTATSKPFRFKIDSVSIENNDLFYSDNAQPKLKTKAIDFNHLGLAGLTIHAAKIISDGNLYSAAISDLSVYESSGFEIQELKGGINYSDTVIQLQNIFLKTAKNQLAANADVRIMKIKGRPDNYRIKSTLSSPGLKLDEVLYFQPDLAQNKYFTPLLNKSIQLNTTMDGTLDNLHIRQLIIRESATRINASADVMNLPDVDRMVINLKLNEFSSTRNDILALLPKGTIQDSLLHYIPEKISLKGNYKGSLDNMYADLQMSSTYGNATIKGTLKNVTDKNRAVYDLTAGLNQLDLASVLSDTSLGKVNGRLTLKGKGFDPKTMASNYSAHIEDAFYSGYTYQNIDITGNIDHYLINADINSEDPNAEIDGNFVINLNEGRRSLKTETHITHLDLNKLGFVTDTLELRGDITADFPLLDTSGITGKLLASGTTISYNGEKLNIDSLTVDARSNLDSQILKITSPYVDINMLGRFRVQNLPGAVRTVINHYVLTDKTKDTVYHQNVDAYLMAKFNIPDSVAILIPGLKSISPSQLIGKLNTSQNEIVFQAKVPYVKYGDFEIDTLVAGITTYKTDGSHYDNLKYVASIGKLTGPSYTLERTYFGGGAMKGVIDGELVFLDQNGKERYKFPYVFTNDPERPNIVVPDSLVINDKKWFVSKNNRIFIDTKHLSGSSLTIGNGNTTIELKTSEHNVAGLPIELRLNQFRIRDIAEILISDTALANGTINGHLDISSITPFRFTTDITIDSLQLMSSKLGNLRALVEQKETGTYSVNTVLKGDHNDVSLVGNYSTETKNADLDLNIKQLELGDFAPITARYLSELGGKIRGQLSIRGSFDEPQIRGKLNADSIHTIYGMTGTFIRIPTAEFVFDENGVGLSELNITDSMGHPGKITGRVNSKNYRSFYADLLFNTKNFEIIGRKKIADQGIYGPTNADINVTIRGNQEAMTVEGKVDVKDKSEFTYVYRSETYDQIGEGLVEFFDPSKPIDTTNVERVRKSKLGFQLLMNMYINITPASTVTIVLDEISGDHLKAKGNADLNFVMKPGGGQELIGTYILDAGEYDLSIAGLIRRKFLIQKGSTINWSGDPLKGTMDITAKYETRISAGELVNDIEHIPGIDKQKLNFDVLIMLKKELLKPDISFKLDMDEQDQEAFDGVIYTRVKQINNIPAELNKQVMGVLAFNQFIAENPFSSFTSSGGDFQTQAFNTAGKLLTQELTDLVGQYVKDVNIDFGLEQEKDYTTGEAIQRTNLQVGLSKSFANNRLNVYVGSTFALEGTNQDTDALAGLAGDVTIEYLLTTDGKYRLKGYRLTDNDMIFQGNIVRTGVSFVLVLEFNKFKNMFKSSKKKSG
ncbi:MAG TPA: hypothetical protein VK166_06915 [Chitinophagaceae bacterium]|nr:hypothetical protein [Chitinophagaceae bacterium]